MGIKGLNSQLQEICKYLQMVVDEKLPINHQIIYQLLDVFNLLPDVLLQEFVKSVYVKTNDQMLVVRYPKTITCENGRLFVLKIKGGNCYCALTRLSWVFLKQLR